MSHAPAWKDAGRDWIDSSWTRIKDNSCCTRREWWLPLVGYRIAPWAHACTWSIRVRRIAPEAKKSCPLWRPRYSIGDFQLAKTEKRVFSHLVFFCFADGDALSFFQSRRFCANTLSLKSTVRPIRSARTVCLAALYRKLCELSFQKYGTTKNACVSSLH